MRQKPKFFNTAIFVTFCAFSFNAAALTYIVKKGDKLSKIAHAHFSGPVWGAQGSLKRTLSLNSEIKNPNLIIPGQKIEIESSPENTSLVVSQSEKIEKIENEKINDRSPSKQDERGGYRLELVPAYRFQALSLRDAATGASSELASRLSLSATISYVQLWSESLESFLGLSLNYLDFEQPTDPSKTLIKSSQFLSGLKSGLKFKVSHGFELEPALAYSKELFGRAVTTSTVTTDAVAVPSLSVKLMYEAMRVGRITLGVTGEASALLPSSTDFYQVRFGRRLGGSIFLKQYVRGEDAMKFQTELGYYNRGQDTSLVFQSERELILSLRLLIGGEK